MKTETKKFWLSDPVTKEITFIMEIDLIESISCNDICLLYTSDAADEAYDV